MIWFRKQTSLFQNTGKLLQGRADQELGTSEKVTPQSSDPNCRGSKPASKPAPKRPKKAGRQPKKMDNQQIGWNKEITKNKNYNNKQWDDCFKDETTISFGWTKTTAETLKLAVEAVEPGEEITKANDLVKQNVLSFGSDLLLWKKTVLVCCCSKICIKLI